MPNLNPSSYKSAVRMQGAEGIPAPPILSPSVVGIAAYESAVDRAPDVLTDINFTVVRSGRLDVSCQVSFTVVDLADGQIPDDYFVGGAPPAGILSFTPGQTEATAVIVFTAGPRPTVTLRARVQLTAPVGCDLDRSSDRFDFVVTPGIEDPVSPYVGLEADFTALRRDPQAIVQREFRVVRKAGPTDENRENSTASGPCTVEWFFRGGTVGGIYPASGFVGGVYPSGTASFADDEYVKTVTFSLSAGAEPTADQSFEVRLRNPVGCIIESDRTALVVTVLKGIVIAPDPNLWRPIAANLAQHTSGVGGGSIVYLANGGFELRGGTANQDSYHVAVFFREPVPTDFELRWYHTGLVDPGAADSGGIWASLVPRAVGTAGFPVKLTDWTNAQFRAPGYTPMADQLYREKSRGSRITHDNDTTTTANADEARIRLWDGSASPGTILAGTPSTNALPMNPRTSRHEMFFRCEGNRFTLGEIGKESVQWTDSRLGTLGLGGQMGWIAFRGRAFRVEEVPGVPFLRDLGGTPPPPPPPDDDLYDDAYPYATTPKASVSVGPLSVDWNTFRRLRTGEDNFPSTMASDGNVYAHGGDGPNSGRRSTNLDQISGSTAAAISVATRIGAGGNWGDPWQRLSGDPEDPAIANGAHLKSYGCLGVGNWVFFSMCPGSGDTNLQWFDVRRTQLGQNGWTKGPQWSGTDKIQFPAFAQAGQGYALRQDEFFYMFAIEQNNANDVYQDPGRVVLARVPFHAQGDTLMVKGNYEWFTGKTGSTVNWGSIGAKLPVHIDGAGMSRSMSVIWLPTFQRWVMLYQYGQGISGSSGNSRVGFMESKFPWGPWREVNRPFLDDPQNRITPSLFHHNLLPRAASVNGDRSQVLLTTGSLPTGANSALSPDALIVLDAQIAAAPGGGGGGDGGTPTGFALTPAYTTNWKKLQLDSTARVVQLPAGVELGGSDDTTANKVALVSKLSKSGDWRATLRLRRLDGFTPGAGEDCLFQLMAGLRGEGSAAFPADVSAWDPQTDPDSHTFRDNARGFRLSFFFQTANDLATTRHVSLAIFQASTSVVAIDPVPDKLFAQAANVDLDFTIIRKANVLTVEVAGVTGAATYTHTLINSEGSSGRFALVVNHRHVRVTNFVVDDPPTGGGGGGGGGDPNEFFSLTNYRPARPTLTADKAPTKTTTVSSGSALQGAINNAVAGEHIVCTGSGSYGSLTINRGFDPNNKLVIRADQLLGPSFGPLTLASCTGVTVRGFRTQKVSINGAQWTRLSQLDVTGGGTGGQVTIDDPRKVGPVRMDHCDIHDFSGPGVKVSSWNDFSGGIQFDNCHIRRQTELQDHNASGSAGYIGLGGGDRLSKSFIRMIWSVCSEIGPGNTWEMKCSDNLVAFVTFFGGSFSGSGERKINVRHGNRNKIIGCTGVDSNTFINCCDYDGHAIGNNCKIQIKNGNVQTTETNLPDKNDVGYSTFAPSKRWKVYSNFGALDVGNGASSNGPRVPAEDTRIFNHTTCSNVSIANAIRTVNQCGSPHPSDEPPATAVRLSFSQVGPKRSG